MFSSNQIFQVSCAEQQLEDVLSFAINMHQISDSTHPKLAYQTTEDGRFVVGRYFDEPKKGWNKFIFEKPSVSLLAEIIKQFVKEHPSNGERFWAGGYEEGYLVEAVPESLAEEENGILNPFYGIVSIRAFLCFYSK